MDKVPFTVYDFFSYLAAGFTLLFAVDASFNLGFFPVASWPVGHVILGIIVAYVVGHAVAHISSVVLEHGFLRKCLGSPAEHLLALEPPSSPWRSIFRGTFEPLPLETRVRVLERAVSENVGDDPMARFYHCRTLVSRNDATLKRLDIFLNLYGFARNLCMAALMSALVLVVSFAWQRPMGSMSDETRLTVAALCVVAAFFLLLRYLKFFREYTLEIFTEYAEPRTDQ